MLQFSVLNLLKHVIPQILRLPGTVSVTTACSFSSSFHTAFFLQACLSIALIFPCFCCTLLSLLPLFSIMSTPVALCNTELPSYLTCYNYYPFAASTISFLITKCRQEKPWRRRLLLNLMQLHYRGA